MEEPLHHLLDINHTRLSVYEWGAERRGEKPTLVLVHATGFHGRCWDQVIRQLPNNHIIALDQRGHGLSSNTPFAGWLTFAEDLVALLEHLEIGDALGVGHSMGGHCCTMAAALSPGLFSRLLLLDPVIFAPPLYDLKAKAEIPPVSEHPVSRRRNHFESVGDTVARYRTRPPFNEFTPEALQDYFQFGLRPLADDAGFQLACPPETEARIYQTAFTNPGIVDAIRTINIPVVVVRAMQAESFDKMRKDFRYSPTWPKLAEAFPRAKDILLAEMTHFMPMEDPACIAGLITEHLFSA